MKYCKHIACGCLKTCRLVVSWEHAYLMQTKLSWFLSEWSADVSVMHVVGRHRCEQAQHRFAANLPSWLMKTAS